MTTTVEPVARPAGRSSGLRRRRVIVAGIAAALLLGGGLTATFTLRHLDHQYGPVQGGPFSGPYSDRGFTFSKDGFSYHLADRSGATAKLLLSLNNLGAHSVKVTSIDTGGDIVTDIKWSVYRYVNGGYVSAGNAPWRAFPAIVPADDTIRLLHTLHHPANCASYQKIDGVSTATYSGYHEVHWESLLHSHTTFVQLLLDRDIRVC